MNRTLVDFIRPIALTLSLVFAANQAADAATPLQTQSAAQPALNGRVPAQIQDAKTVFFTNSAADPNFPIDPNRAYNDLYADLQSWGRYQLVDSPAKADLIFRLHDVAPITNVSGTDRNVYSITSPAFQLTILDAKTNTALWTVNSPVTLAGRKQVFDRWVTLSEQNLVSRVEVLSGHTLSAEQSAELTTYPKTHGRRNVILLVSAGVGAAVASGLILHHEFENGVANQKSQTDAFCTANNIPLSQCAGG